MKSNNRSKRIFAVVLMFLSLLAMVSGVYCYIHDVRNKQPAKSRKVTPEKILPIEEDINLENYHKVPVVFALDNNYVLPACVAINSMLENCNKDTFYKISILTSDDFKATNRDTFLKLKNDYKNFRIDFLSMYDLFSDAYYNTRFPKSVYYRLKIPSIFSEEEKMLYLDADIIVTQDLSELYNIDLKDNYLGAVADGTRSTKKGDPYLKELGIDVSGYVNSGVIIWNSKKCREDGIEEKFKEYIDSRKTIKYPDQDTINVVCYDKILSLPLKYNCQVCYPLDENFNKSKMVKKCFANHEDWWEDGRKNPIIIHYAYPTKPWNEPNGIFFAEKWWQLAERSYFWDAIYTKYFTTLSPENKALASSYVSEKSSFF